jgi:DNA-binding MurR/RpiR family transcriptional regulator
VELATVIAQRHAFFSPGERKVAEVALREPEQVAFGTLAAFAERVGTSGTTVLRTASKLGFDGFGELQDHVQRELADRLRPAAQKIREARPADATTHAMQVETDNLSSTFTGIDQAQFAEAGRKLALAPGRVLVLAAECVAHIGAMFVDLLSTIRQDVIVAGGNAVRLAKIIGQPTGDDVVLVMDQRRYDRWLLRALSILAEQGAYIIAISDSPLSPLARAADAAFTVSAAGAGPFDSQVATLALCQALVTNASSHIISAATSRLDAVEANWASLEALTDD